MTAEYRWGKVMEMLVKIMEVLVKIAVMMMAPGSAPAPPEARGREAPFFLFFLDLLPRWEKGFPFGPWLQWLGRARAPLRLDLSLCFYVLEFCPGPVSFVSRDP